MCLYASRRLILVAVSLHLVLCSTTHSSAPMDVSTKALDLTDFLAKQDLIMDQIGALVKSLQSLQDAPTAHSPTQPSPPPRRCFTSPPAPAIQAVPPPQGLSQEEVQDGDSLHAASARDDADALVALLRRGARLQERDARGDTALHVAAREGAHAATAALLLWGADARTRGALLRTPLHAAAAHGQLESARRLVEAGAPLGARDARGATALALAARLDSLLEWLVERGPAVEWAEWADAAGDTALLAAARAGRWAWAGWLAARGASPAARGRDGVSPLVLAARGAGPGALAALEAMLRGGALCDAGEVARALAAAAGAAQVWAIAQAAPQEVAGAAGQEALRQAARDGRQEALAALLATGVDPALPDAHGHTALQLAARAGHVASVHALLPHLTDRPDLVLLALNHTHSAAVATALDEAHTELLRGPVGSNLLVQALRDGRCAVASALVALEIQLEAEDAQKTIDMLVEGGKKECVEFVLSHFANRTQTVEDVLLHTHSVKVAKTLGVAANALLRSSTGTKILMHVVREGRCEVASALLAFDIQLEAEVAQKTIEMVVEGGKNGCVETFLAHFTNRTHTVEHVLLHTHSEKVAKALGVVANALLRSHTGSNLLIQALRDGRCAVVSALAALVTQQQQMDAANFLAQPGNNSKCLGFFLDGVQTMEDKTELVGHFMNTTTSPEVLVAVAKTVPEVFRAAAGDQALTRAVEGGRCLVASALLAAGAGEGAGAEDAVRALEVAAEGADAECVRALRAGGVAPLAGDRWQRALRDAAKDGRRAALLALLAAGVEVDAKDAGGHSALTLAVEKGHADCVEELLKAGADVNSRIPNESEDTVLIYATWKGYVDVVRMLLKYHADVNLKTKDKNSALIIMAWKNNMNIGRLLLDAHADVNARNSYGDTALKWATHNGSVELVRMLLESNADVTVKNNSGKTALDDASNQGFKEIEQMLRERMRGTLIA